jgi:iron complex outermembrane receptor protein
MDNNKQPIPFASVIVKGTNIGTTANGDGSYRLGNLPKGNISIRASFIGYTIQDKDITLDADTEQSLDFELKESSSQLDEVIVSAGRRVESLAETPSSVTVVNAKEIGALSTISPNIANILAFSVPGLGASTNQTGNSGQTLRGRNLLVLIDGIPQLKEPQQFTETVPMAD